MSFLIHLPPPLPEVPEHVTYILVGAGTASFAAYRAIRKADKSAKVRYLKLWSFTCKCKEITLHLSRGAFLCNQSLEVSHDSLKWPWKTFFLTSMQNYNMQVYRNVSLCLWLKGWCITFQLANEGVILKNIVTKLILLVEPSNFWKTCLAYCTLVSEWWSKCIGHSQYNNYNKHNN